MLEAETNAEMGGAHDEPFIQRIEMELRRAERYRIFVSLVVLDLDFLRSQEGENGGSLMDGIVDLVATNIRVIDLFAVVGASKVAVLMPETQRQGAEAAAKRLTTLIGSEIETQTKQALEKMIPLEMASYPDAAGARSIKEILSDLSEGASLN